MAGFEVTGVDIRAQPRYCGDHFMQADALDVSLAGYDVIHASPPCQGYSRMRHLPWLAGRTWPLLIEPVRERLRASGAYWVIENVEDAPLQGVTLCGQSFGLAIYRHRRFESSLLLLAPAHQRHAVTIVPGRLFSGNHRVVAAHGYVCAPSKVPRAAAQRALGIDWMTSAEMGQAIPPAYTHWVGMQLMAALAHEPQVAS